MYVIVADDQPDVRSALKLILEERPGISKVAEVNNAAELCTLLTLACPDLVLLDWELPGIEPRELIGMFRAICPALKIIVLSSMPQHRQTALDAGALYFVCKSDPPDLLLKAVDECYKTTG